MAGDSLSALDKISYRDFAALPGSVWECSCGFTGTRAEVMGHRKGFKNRPECQRKNAQGKSLWCIDLGDSPLARQLLASEAAPPNSAPGATPLQPPAPEPAVEICEDAPPVAEEAVRLARAPAPEEPAPEADPEAVARALLGNAREGPLARLEGLSELLARQEDDGGPPELPAGDWSLEDPPETITSTRTTVSVHIRAELLLAYDWCVAHGWKGNLDTWVDEMLIDHWTNCMGKVIAVGDRVDFDGSNIGQDDTRVEAGVPA